MYAVVSCGGKQYRLAEGDIVDVEKLEGEVGEQVALDQVLFVGDGSDSECGAPLVDGARVVGTIVEQKRGDKLIVFKFKRRKMYRRKVGHRQLVTRFRVDSIEVQGSGRRQAAKVDDKKAEAPQRSTDDQSEKAAAADRKGTADEGKSSRKKMQTGSEA
jgi:large subunit ribosomal protein L21